MLGEILEGVCDYFKDDDDILVDCLIFLKNNLKNVNETLIYDILDNLNRCHMCGSEKIFYEWSEAHTELESNNLEYHSYSCCPNCKQ